MYATNSLGFKKPWKSMISVSIVIAEIKYKNNFHKWVNNVADKIKMFSIKWYNYII